MRILASMSFHTCTYLVLMLLLNGCSKVFVDHPFDIIVDNYTNNDYQFGPEDVIEVLVWKNDDLSKVVTVRPDGKISLPLIGDIQVAGFTATQVKQEIVNR